MDANNLLVSIVSNNMQFSGKQNTKTSKEQNSFLNLINVVMQNKIGNNEITEMDLSNSNNDIIDMFLKGNLNEKLIDSNNSNENVINLLQTDKQSDKESKISETDYNNLIGMFFNFTQNIQYPEMQKLSSSEIINSQNIQQVSVIESLISNSKAENNFNKVFKEIPATSKNSLVEKLIVNNEVSKTTKEGTTINKEITSSDQMKSNIKSGDYTSTIDSKVGYLKEEDLNHNEKVKNDSSIVDFDKGIVETKNVIISNNNKIIEISDESSEIKTNVLNQVKDKVVLMAKDKEGTQEVNMELFPNNLGKVNIKMSINADKITVEIMALNDKTGNILLSNAQELTKVLQKNFNEGTVNVIVTENSLNLYNQSNLNYNQQQNNKEQSYKNQFFNNEITDINKDEDGNITEMINLRNLKLNKVV